MALHSPEMPSEDSEIDPAFTALYAAVLELPKSMPMPGGIFHVNVLGDVEAPEATRDQPISKRQWQRSYHYLHAGAIPPVELRNPDDLEQMARDAKAREIVPIALAYFQYASASPIFEDYEKTRRAERPFEAPAADRLRNLVAERTTFFACAYLPDQFDFLELLPHVHYGLKVRLAISNELVVTNVRDPLQQLEVDFADGNGYRTARLDEEIEITFPAPGQYVLKVRGKAGGNTIESSFELAVEEHIAESPHEHWTGITSGHPFKGVIAKGHAWVFYGSGHSTKDRVEPLIRPIMISEGFPGNYDLDDLWGIVDQHGLANGILGGGRDLIIFGYEDGTTYIEANAGVAIACVKRAIEQCVSGSKVTVGGASMGGLITRYALTYMEFLKDPDIGKVDMFVTLDSPHMGAVIPLGLQCTLDAFSTEADIKAKKKLVDSLASQEMLLVWYDSDQDSFMKPSPKRKDFETNLNGIGFFPKSMPSFAIADGRGDGTGNATPPGQIALGWNIGVAYLTIATFPGIWSSLFRRYVCAAQNPKRWSAVKYYYVPGDTLSWDSAQGGTNDFFKQVKDNLPSGPKELRYADACFIPTASALCMPDVKFESNKALFRNLNQQTPGSKFSSIIWQKDNNDHVAIPIESALWLSEALGVIVLLLDWASRGYDGKAWIPSACLSAENRIVSVHEGPSEHQLHYRVGIVTSQQTIDWDSHSHTYDPGGNRPTIAINGQDEFVEVHQTAKKDGTLYYYRGHLDSREPMRLIFDGASQLLKEKGTGDLVRGSQTRVAIRDNVVALVFLSPDRNELKYLLGTLSSEPGIVDWLIPETIFRRPNDKMLISSPSVAITRDFDALIVFAAETFRDPHVRYQVGRIVRSGTGISNKVEWITPESVRYGGGYARTPTVAVNEFGTLIAVNSYPTNASTNLQYLVGTIVDGAVTLPQRASPLQGWKQPGGQWPVVTLNNRNFVVTVCEREKPDGEAWAFTGAWRGSQSRA
jgi:hypothetical protein